MLSSPGKKRARENSVEIFGSSSSSSSSSTASANVTHSNPNPNHPSTLNFHTNGSNTHASSSSSVPSTGILIQHTDSLILLHQRNSNHQQKTPSVASQPSSHPHPSSSSSFATATSLTPSLSSSYVQAISTPIQTSIPSSAFPSVSDNHYTATTMNNSSLALSTSMLNSSSLGTATAANLNVSQLASTTGGRVCTISSHARLEALVKQTELLRKLDTDMHEAIKAKMQEQINRLVGQVEELTHALDTAREWSIDSRTVETNDTHNTGNNGTHNAARTGSRSSNSSSSLSSAPLPSTNSNSVTELQQHIQALTHDNHHLRNLLEENSRNYTTMLNKYESNWTTTQTELNQAQQRIMELERLQDHQSLMDTQFGSLLSGSSTASSNDATNRIGKLESEISKVREEVRSYQRKERTLLDEIKKLTVKSSNELLLQEQIHALQTKVNRYEPLAIEMLTYRNRFETAVKTLQLWEKEIFQPLVQTDQTNTEGRSTVSSNDEKKIVTALERTKNNLGASGYAFSSSSSDNSTIHNDSVSFQATLASLFNLPSDLSSRTWTKDEEESYVQQYIQRTKDNIGTVSSIISELQSSQQLLITSITENQTKLGSRSKHYDELSQRYTTLMQQLSEAQKIRNDNDIEIKRLQLKIETLQTNTDRLQALIHNYEAEDRATIALRIASEAHSNLITVVAAGTSTTSSVPSTTGTANTNTSSKPTKALITAASEASTKARDAMLAAQAETQSIKQRCKTLENIVQIYQTSLTNILNTFSNYSNPAIIQTLEQRIKLADNEIEALRSELMVVYGSTPKVSSASLLASSLSTYYPPPKSDTFEAEPSGLSTWTNGQPHFDNTANSSTNNTNGTNGNRYRVLHLVANPTAHALKEAEQKQKQFLENCKQEIQKLREIIHHHNTQIQHLTIENEKLKHSMMLQMTNSMDTNSKNVLLNANNENMILSAFTLDGSNTNNSSSSSGTATASSTLNTSTFQIRSAALDNDTSTIGNSTNSNGGGGNNAADFDKFRERFKTMFKVQIELFRDIVYRLTGWLITMPFSNAANNTPRDIILKSVYAENENDYLHFRFHDDTLELIDTPFVASLPPGAFTFLSLTKDFPPFLAAVITDLSSKQTMSSTIGG